MERTKFRFTSSRGLIDVRSGDCLNIIDSLGKVFCSLKVEKPMYILIERQNTGTRTRENTIKKEAIASTKSQKISMDLFRKFWNIYPRKVGRGSAIKAWEKLCRRRTTLVCPTWEEIKSAILEQKKTEQWKNPQYIPYPATWLNQYRWLNDPKDMKAQDFSHKKPFITYEGRRFDLCPDGRYRNVHGEIYIE